MDSTYHAANADTAEPNAHANGQQEAYTKRHNTNTIYSQHSPTQKANNPGTEDSTKHNYQNSSNDYAKNLTKKSNTMAVGNMGNATTDPTTIY